MNSKNETISEDAPKGAWDAPLPEFNKKHILAVTVYDDKDNIIVHHVIDYGNYNHRKFLGKLTFWATNNHYSVETLNKDDHDKANG